MGQSIILHSIDSYKTAAEFDAIAATAVANKASYKNVSDVKVVDYYDGKKYLAIYTKNGCTEADIKPIIEVK